MIEERISMEYAKQEMRCPVHLSIGQEGSAVGVCAAIPKDSLMFSGHRSHAHYLAKGGDLKRMIAELHGKVTGCTGGNGGSMHLIDRSVGFEGATSIVAGTVPVAVGAAWAMKLRNDPRLVVSWLGDAAIEEGVVWESFNFAARYDLHILFVIEDNGYSCYTSRDVRQVGSVLTNIGMPFAMYTELATGDNTLSIARKTKSLIQRIGPTLLIIQTERVMEHCGPGNDDYLGYRPPLQPENFDPLYGISPDPEYAAIVEAEINSAFEFARNSEFPPKSELGAYVYAK